MKQVRLIMVFALLFFVLAPSVWAQNPGPYLGIYVGEQLLSPKQSEDSLGTFNLEYRPAVSGSVVLGWELQPGSDIGEGRFEIEYAHRSNRLDQAEFADGKVSGDGDLSADSLLVNTFGVYRTKSLWTPYFGLGLGVARISAANLTVTGEPLADDNALVFAYQIGTGVDLQLTKKLTLDFGYRLFSTAKAKLTEANGDKFETGYLSHSLLVGLRLGF